VSRVRQRRYRNVAVVNHGRHEHLRAGGIIAKLKGQRFGRASACRTLSVTKSQPSTPICAARECCND
jgi:hypothetical protein